MLDSAGKRVTEQGQLQFLAECRKRLDIPVGCRQRIPRARRSHWKRTVTEGGSKCQWQDQCWRRSRPETATWSHISRPMKHLSKQCLSGMVSSINKDFLKVIWLCGHLASTKRR